jgi:hypothetical protein
MPQIHVYLLLEEDLNVVAYQHNELHLANVYELNLLLDLNKNIGFSMKKIMIKNL